MKLSIEEMDRLIKAYHINPPYFWKRFPKLPTTQDKLERMIFMWLDEHKQEKLQAKNPKLDVQVSMFNKKKSVSQEKGQLVALGFLPMGSHFRTKGFHYVITQPGRQFVDATRSGHVKSGGNGYVIDRRNGADMVEWIATTEPGPGIMGAVGSIQADVTKVRSAVDDLQRLVAQTFKGIKAPERKVKEPAREQVEKKARRSKKREREEEDRRRREYEDSIPF